MTAVIFYYYFAFGFVGHFPVVVTVALIYVLLLAGRLGQEPLIIHHTTAFSVSVILCVRAIYAIGWICCVLVDAVGKYGYG